MTDTLIHFPLYIGDTLKRFIEHPTLAERGAWISITVALVQNDGVLVDDDTLYYKCLAFNDADKQVLKQVLSKCFTKASEGWVDEHTTLLIESQKILREKRRLAGQVGGKSRKTTQANAKANASVLLKQSESESESEPELKLELKKDNTKVLSKEIDVMTLYSALSIQKSFEDKFTEFWNLYGIKKGRSDCEKKYAKLLKDGVVHEDIISGVKAYQQECIKMAVERQYIKQPLTFLNGKHWLDEYERELTREEKLAEIQRNIGRTTCKQLNS